MNMVKRRECFGKALAAAVFSSVCAAGLAASGASLREYVAAFNAADDENAAKALKQLPLLAGCDMHLTVIPSQTEMSTLRKLKINFTCEPKYSGNKLFRL